MKSFKQFLGEANTKRIERQERAIYLNRGPDSPQYKNIQLRRRMASDSSYVRGADDPQFGSQPSRQQPTKQLRQTLGQPEVRTAGSPHMQRAQAVLKATLDSHRRAREKQQARK